MVPFFFDGWGGLTDSLGLWHCCPPDTWENPANSGSGPHASLSHQSSCFFPILPVKGWPISLPVMLLHAAFSKHGPKVLISTLSQEIEMLKAKYYKSDVVWVLYGENLFQIPIAASLLAALCLGDLQREITCLPRQQNKHGKIFPAVFWRSSCWVLGDTYWHPVPLSNSTEPLPIWQYPLGSPVAFPQSSCKFLPLSYL